jgi:hypothetical protein
MDNLKQQVAALPTVAVNGHHYLSYQAVTDKVAAFLFPDQPSSQIDAAPTNTSWKRPIPSAANWATMKLSA